MIHIIDHQALFFKVPIESGIGILIHITPFFSSRYLGKMCSNEISKSILIRSEYNLRRLTIYV